MQIKIVDLAYMAGYFDGEGCITMMKNGTRSFHFRIALVSRDLSSLLLFAKYFGGKITTHRQTYKGVTRLYWAWYQRSKRAQRVLLVLLPLLRGKRDKAEAALRLTFHAGLPLSQNEISLRAAFYGNKLSYSMIKITKDGRTIRTGKDYTKFRFDLHRQQDGNCVRCGRFTSLTADLLLDFSFHLHHVGGRGMGGSKRDDVFGKVEGLCGKDHREEHKQCLPSNNRA